jgi:hypothetical protein
LSSIVQAVFGWHGYHLWVFETARGEFGLPDPELGRGLGVRRAAGDPGRSAARGARGTVEWLGIDSAEEFDPAAFDQAEINRELTALARP